MSAPVRSHALAARLALCAAALAGCAHTAAAPSAPSVDAAAVARAVVLCTTTEADLRRSLGAPTRDGRFRDARVVSWVTGEEGVVHFLAVLLDARGVVVDLYWDLPDEIPWTPTDQCQ